VRRDCCCRNDRRYLCRAPGGCSWPRAIDNNGL